MLPAVKNSEESSQQPSNQHQVALTHRLSVGTICNSGLQALRLKKRKLPLYPKDSVHLFSAFPSSWPCIKHENTPLNSQRTSTTCSNSIRGSDDNNDGDSCTEDSEFRIHIVKDAICSICKADESVLHGLVQVEEEFHLRSREESLDAKRSNADRSITVQEPTRVGTRLHEDTHRRLNHKTRQKSKILPWDDDETCGTFSSIQPEITTNTNSPRLKRRCSRSNSRNETTATDSIRRHVPQGNEEAIFDREDDLSADYYYFDSITPEITETVRQQSLMSVPGAVAIPGINTRSYPDSDDETTVSMLEAMRQISTMGGESLFRQRSDCTPQIIETSREQSMISVPGAVAIESGHGRFSSDADSDNETAINSVRQPFGRDSNIRTSSDILVQGVLANANANIQAYVSVSVVSQAPVVDADGIHVINVDDDEEERTESTIFKTTHWGRLLVCMVTAAVIGCTVTFLTITNQRADSEHIFIQSESPTISPTFVPTNSQLPNIIDIIKTVTREEVLQDRATPQFQAARWISIDTAQKDLSDEKIIQRYVLAIMQFAFGIDLVCKERSCSFNHSPVPLLTEADECTWNGIACNEDGFVTRVLLFGRSANIALQDVTGWQTLPPPGKNGILPSEVKALTELSVMVIEGFSITGPIAHIFDPNLSKLRTIRLSGNALTGSLPDGLWKTHINLEILDLSNNELSGPIPDGINRLTSLSKWNGPLNIEIIIVVRLGLMIKLADTLNLGMNEFTGTIPSSIGDMQSLKELNLRRTRLTGTLPFEIGGISSSLMRLDLSHTAMGGPLPEELELFHMLEVLNLEECSFDGPIPELSCENAQMIRLNGNKFSGTIPSMNNCTRLEHLNLRDNPFLTGEISDALCGDEWQYTQEFTSFRVDCDIICGCCDFNAQCDDDW